jgi:histone acetyltransferase (RNA polymerase elongator complex component)
VIISVFTPHGGCPERCTFCDQKVSGGSAVSAKFVTETIEAHLASGTTHATEIAFYGGTFTGMPKERQLSYLAATQPFLKTGQIGGVRIATRPDALERDWLLRLRDEFGLKTVELGVQSFNPAVLQALGRSHRVDQIEPAVSLLKELNLTTSLHLMIGTPNEQTQDDALTLEWLSRLRPDYIRLHPLLVIRGTALEKSWRDGGFTPLSLDEAVTRASSLTFSIEALGIKTIRLGLQPNELLSENVLAGPYHPAFGELVFARLARNELEERLKHLCFGDGSSLSIETYDPKRAHLLKGHKKSNLAWIKERFNLSSIEVIVVNDRPQTYDNKNFEIRLRHSPRSS